MRVIKPSRIREYAKIYPDAAPPLMAWLNLARKAQWRSIQDIRLTIASADGVKVASGSTVTVFNIGGNKYRLLAAIHFDRAKVFVLRFMTHAQYDREKWKREL